MFSIYRYNYCGRNMFFYSMNVQNVCFSQVTCCQFSFRPSGSASVPEDRFASVSKWAPDNLSRPKIHFCTYRDFRAHLLSSNPRRTGLSLLHPRRAILACASDTCMI